MPIHEGLAICLLLIVAYIQPGKDLSHYDGSGWWRRHIFIWACRYLPTCYIVYWHIPWPYWVPLAVVASYLWQQGMSNWGKEYFKNHVRWDSLQYRFWSRIFPWMKP